MEACQNAEVLKVIYFGLLIFNIIKIVIPIGLIVLGTIDFAKGVINVEDSKKNDRKKIFFKRIIYALLVFLVPTIVNMIIVSLGKVTEGVTVLNCITDANPTRIKELESLQKEEEETYPNNPSDVHQEEQGVVDLDDKGDEQAINDGYATGYLKSPINSSASQQEFINSIGSNSKTLYYRFDGPMKGKYHGGTDLPVGVGTTVYAMDGGIVYKVQDGCGSYGRHIIIEHVVNGKKYYTIYAHLNSIEGKYKTTGMAVHSGDKIGYSGNSYHCTGETTVDAHLHVGISFNSNGSFPQTDGDNSFLVGNFIGTNTKYSVVDSSNLTYYKKCQYCS